MYERYKGIIIDLLLIAWAALVPYHPVEDWLMDYRTVVYWAMGGVHLLVLPWRVLWRLTTAEQPSTASSDEVFGADNGPLEKIFIYSFVLFFGCSWMIPIFLGFTLHAGTALSYYTFLFGPYVLLGISIAGLLYLDKRTNHALSRQAASPKRWLLRATQIGRASCRERVSSPV